MAPKAAKTAAKATKEPEKEEAQTNGEEVPGKAEDQNEVVTKDEATASKMDEDKVEDKDDQEKPKEPEAPKELEENAPAIKGAKVQEGAVTFSSSDCTINFMSTAEGRLCTSLGEGGMQYLLAGARATAGVKSGRYMFEIKVVDTRSLPDTQGPGNRTGTPNHHVRVGVSLAGSSLFLGDDANSACFDSEGFFFQNKHRSKISMPGVNSSKFAREQTIALLVNLDKSSPNANTLSLFRNGSRVSTPQAIPEHMLGKPLFPAVTFKNVTLQVNFGPVPEVALPFTCHFLGAAGAADVDIKKVPAPAGGKHEVVFPVGLPDQGYFDWVDLFLEKNPDYIELSDRKIAEWAVKSGVWKGKKEGGSVDKPNVKFGIPQLDDMSAKKVIMAVAPSLKRNYIVPELKSNLVEGDRKGLLKRFWPAHFKKTATVVMGEPNADYKQQVQSILLSNKQAKADVEKRKKNAEETRKRVLQQKQKKDEAPKDEESKEEDAAIEAEDPPVQLSDEEKKIVHRKLESPDISEQVLSKSFASFSLPSTTEGFDAVTFAWEKEAACTEVFKSWKLQKKMTSRAEDLEPGAWFKEEWQKFQKQVQEWRKRQNEHKDPARRKAYLAKKKELAKKKREEEGEAKEDEANDEEEMNIDVDELDISSVADVSDIGNGEPLFAYFKPEDWILVNTRYEFHLLLHSFKKDLDDSDRPSFGEAHLGFYYTKYYKRHFNVQSYGMSKVADFLDLIKDSVKMVDDTKMLSPVLPEDTPLDTFVKLSEEHRRERQRRLDAGDESAELKITRPSPQPPTYAPQAAPRRPGLHNSGNAQPSRNAPAAAAGVKRIYSPAPRAPGPVPGPATKAPRVWQPAQRR